MIEQMELTEPQKEIVRHMQEGSSLLFNTAFNIYVPIYLKMMPDIRVDSRDFSFLLDNGLIEYEGKFSIMTDIYSLTVIGQQITL